MRLSGDRSGDSQRAERRDDAPASVPRACLSNHRPDRQRAPRNAPDRYRVNPRVADPRRGLARWLVDWAIASMGTGLSRDGPCCSRAIARPPTAWRSQRHDSDRPLARGYAEVQRGRGSSTLRRRNGHADGRRLVPAFGEMLGALARHGAGRVNLPSASEVGSGSRRSRRSLSRGFRRRAPPCRSS